MSKRRHGIGEYPRDWPQISKRIKDQAGWKCERCGHPHEPKAGYALTTHHLVMLNDLCEDWNLAALCQRCHLKIQNKIFMPQFFMLEHSPWFKPHVEGFYLWASRAYGEGKLTIST